MRIRPLSADAPVTSELQTNPPKVDWVKWGLVGLAVVGAYFVLFRSESKGTSYKPSYL